MATPTQTSDVLNRYLFDDLHVRGELVQLSESYQQIIAKHNYPKGVQVLLGELLAATCLLTATLKFEGEITVQLQGDGPISYMSINGNNRQEMRGIARLRETSEVLTQLTGLQNLIGKGTMVITIRPNEGEPYQGVVALEEETLADCLAHYFEMSEQIPTKIWLFGSNNDSIEQKTIGGALLQLLPDSGDKEQQQADFEHLCQLTETLKAEEVITLPAETLLYRLYNQEKVRIFDPQAVAYVCGCSEDKCLTAIAQIAPVELNNILAEKGSVDMTCDYCLTTYCFNKNQLAIYLCDNDSKAKLN